MARYFVFILSLLISVYVSPAQDTIRIEEVSLQSSLRQQSLFRSPAAATVIDSTQLRTAATLSFTAAVNSAPGVRMEERSPGSYRLSIRGSLIRSPFGIRNVKVYVDDLPFTDAGGNSYLNIMGLSAVQSMEVLKGPDGSLSGANSGGVLYLRTTARKDQLVAEAGGGSYGLFKQSIVLSKQTGKHRFNIAEDYQRSDGYRQNSKFNRLYLQAGDEWNYSRNARLRFLLLYADLFYQTPGGLTAMQYKDNPVQARPSTSTMPGAREQKAAVYNNMLFGGITHEAMVRPGLEHVVAVFGSLVDFKNPFITNYETRKEKTFGARTFFLLKSNAAQTKLKAEYVLGAEWQQTNASIVNYTNLAGAKGNLLAAGDIRSGQHFIFSRLKLDIHYRLLVEAGLSLNGYHYHFTDSAHVSNHFKPVWMPRLAMSYAITKKISLRASVSRGYSTPTTAEIRPSDNIVYAGLAAETGSNIEFGGRLFIGHRFWADVALYDYRLHNSIVRQQNTSGTEYFINAGKISQQGLEIQWTYALVQNPITTHGIKKLTIGNATTLNKFVFRNYETASGNFSGNHITGVPKYIFVSHLALDMANGFYGFAQYNHTSRIPLNDANAFYAKSYDLVLLKAGFAFRLKRSVLSVYLGVDNLLNEVYSLGNDLNAAGNRFYNASAKRNYFSGLVFRRP